MVLQPLSNWWPQFSFCGLGGAKALGLHEGSPFSWGTSPSLDGVSKLRLFRSHWFGCFYSCSCRLQWSCSAVFSSSSYKTEKGGVTWVGVFLECLSLILDLRQRVVPPEVHLPRSAAGGFSAPAAPPRGWGHLQGETSQGVGCPFCSAGKGMTRGWARSQARWRLQ